MSWKKETPGRAESISGRTDALRWVVFQRLMERYNSEFLGDEATVRRIEEAVDKAARELETKDEVVIEVPFISKGTQEVNAGPAHFREVIRREDLAHLDDEEPWMEEAEERTTEEIEEVRYQPEAPPALGPESSSGGLFFLLAILAAFVAAILSYLR